MQQQSDPFYMTGHCLVANTRKNHIHPSKALMKATPTAIYCMHTFRMTSVEAAEMKKREERRVCRALSLLLFSRKQYTTRIPRIALLRLPVWRSNSSYSGMTMDFQAWFQFNLGQGDASMKLGWKRGRICSCNFSTFNFIELLLNIYAAKW